MTSDGSVEKREATETGKPKPTGKLGAGKPTPEEHKRRFIEAAWEAGASEDEAEFDAALKRIAQPRAAGRGS